MVLDHEMNNALKRPSHSHVKNSLQRLQTGNLRLFLVLERGRILRLSVQSFSPPLVDGLVEGSECSAILDKSIGELTGD